MKNERTPSNVLVTPLITTRFCEWAKTVADRSSEFKNDITVSMQTLAVAKTPTMTYFICNDGVGWEEFVGYAESEPMPVIVHERKDATTEICSTFEVEITSQRFLELCDELPAIPLEDFIRRGGNRIENNYEEWRKVLNA